MARRYDGMVTADVEGRVCEILDFPWWRLDRWIAWWRIPAARRTKARVPGRDVLAVLTGRRASSSTRWH